MRIVQLLNCLMNCNETSTRLKFPLKMWIPKTIIKFWIKRSVFNVGQEKIGKNQHQTLKLLPDGEMTASELAKDLGNGELK